MNELIICAAWMTEEGIAVRGHRHPHCRDSAISMNLEPRRGTAYQGFITSTNRFVDRHEACEIFKRAGQKSEATFQVLSDSVTVLFSEDLY